MACKWGPWEDKYVAERGLRSTMSGYVLTTPAHELRVRTLSSGTYPVKRAQMRISSIRFGMGRRAPFASTPCLTQADQAVGPLLFLFGIHPPDHHYPPRELHPAVRDGTRGGEGRGGWTLPATPVVRVWGKKEYLVLRSGSGRTP